MPIETLEDIVEEICNQMQVYGAHDSRCNGDECRSCVASDLTSRIRRALDTERKLSTHSD